MSSTTAPATSDASYIEMQPQTASQFNDRVPLVSEDDVSYSTTLFTEPGFCRQKTYMWMLVVLSIVQFIAIIMLAGQISGQTTNSPNTQVANCNVLPTMTLEGTTAAALLEGPTPPTPESSQSNEVSMTTSLPTHGHTVLRRVRGNEYY